MSDTSAPIHTTYLPFSESHLASHFVHCEEETKAKYLAYYVKSAMRYKKFCDEYPERSGLPLSVTRGPCQIEKDERFWTSACLMTFYHSANPAAAYANLLARAFGEAPPMKEPSSWQECLSGKLHLSFETMLPAPQSYKHWLKHNLLNRHLIPHVIQAGRRPSGDAFRDDLEGPTHVDALLICEKSGFAVIFEAKVLSDLSCDISFDVARNQLARNIDVMLERNSRHSAPLDLRDPSRTLFVLLTPGIFRKHPASRLYGRLLPEYKQSAENLARDLPHRCSADLEGVPSRLGWITWEDCREVLPDACAWLPTSDCASKA